MCDDGDVRVLMGETKGQVEMCTNRRWATLSHNYNRWTDKEAIVACRQLGYSGGKRL